MKNILFFITLAYSAPLFSQDAAKAVYTDNRYRIEPFQLAYAMPLGTSSNSFVLGPLKGAGGVGIGIGKRMFGDWILGLSYTAISYQFDNDKIASFVQNRYSDPKYYTTVATDITQSAVSVILLKMGRDYHFRKVELEPYAAMGLGFPSSIFRSSIHRKLKEDNYSEDIVLSNDGINNTFFMPAIGVHAFTPLCHWLYLDLNVEYSYAALRLGFNENTTDFLGNTSSQNIYYNYNLSQLTVKASLQMRFGRLRAHTPNVKRN